MIQFKTTILQLGNNTGIEVPEKILEQLGSSKRPLVIVSLNNYVYRSAVAKMGDKYSICCNGKSCSWI